MLNIYVDGMVVLDCRATCHLDQGFFMHYFEGSHQSQHAKLYHLSVHQVKTIAQLPNYIPPYCEIKLLVKYIVRKALPLRELKGGDVYLHTQWLYALHF